MDIQTDQAIRARNILHLQNEILNIERALLIALQKLGEMKLDLTDLDTPKG